MVFTTLTHRAKGTFIPIFLKRLAVTNSRVYANSFAETRGQRTQTVLNISYTDESIRSIHNLS